MPRMVPARVPLKLSAAMARGAAAEGAAHSAYRGDVGAYSRESVVVPAAQPIVIRSGHPKCALPLYSRRLWVCDA